MERNENPGKTRTKVFQTLDGVQLDGPSRDFFYDRHGTRVGDSKLSDVLASNTVMGEALRRSEVTLENQTVKVTGEAVAVAATYGEVKPAESTK